MGDRFGIGVGGGARGVVLLAHDFPPALGGGAPRLEALARHLPAHGWLPRVLAARTAGDETAPLPEGVVVRRTRTLLPRPRAERAGARLRPEGSGGPLTSPLLNRVRDALLFPDARVLWWPTAFPAALGMARAPEVRVVLASAPPFSVLELGRLVCAVTRKPLVVDLRDPWSHAFDDARAGETPARARRERAMEARVVRAARGIIVTTDAYAEALSDRYPHAADRVAVVPNGYDVGSADGPAERGDRFSIVYAGRFARTYELDGVLDALASLATSSPELAGAMRFHVLGPIDPSYRERLSAEPLSALARVHGPVPRAVAERYVRGADLLLAAVGPLLGTLRTTGKVFSCLASGRPVIAYVPVEGPTARVLEEAGSGRLVPHGDVVGLATAMAAAIRAGRVPLDRSVSLRPAFRARYASDRLAGEVAGVLASAAGEPVGDGER